MRSVNHKLYKVKMLPSIAIGNIVYGIVCVAAALICPIFVLNGVIEGDSFRIIANIVRWIGVFAGVMSAACLVEDRRLITVILCTVTNVLISLMCAIPFFAIDGSSIVWGLLAAALGMLCAFFLIFKQKKPIKHHRNLSRSR